MAKRGLKEVILNRVLKIDEIMVGQRWKLIYYVELFSQLLDDKYCFLSPSTFSFKLYYVIIVCKMLQERFHHVLHLFVMSLELRYNTWGRDHRILTTNQKFFKFYKKLDETLPQLSVGHLKS